MIDGHSVVAFGAGRNQRFDCWNDAYTHDHHVRRHGGTCREEHARCLSGNSLDALHSCTEAQVDTTRAVLGLVETGQGLASNASEHPVECLENGHFFP
ncbi:hypothetical protein D3C86_1662240 [compost metagenome]